MVDPNMEQAVKMVMTQTGCATEREAIGYLESRALAMDETFEQACLDVVDGTYVFPHE